MVNFQLSPNLAQVQAIDTHLGRSFAQAFRIALPFWFRRVLAIAVHAAIPLRTRICSACFVLTSRFVAMWTYYHLPILAHPFSHSRRLWANELHCSIDYNLVLCQPTQHATHNGLCRQQESWDLFRYFY